MASPRRFASLVRFGLALALLAAGIAGLGQGPAPAGAVVQQVSGYRATVLGWTSWYGSYGLGAEGTAWCIDHGIRAPDPALRYVPTTLTGVPVSTQTAMAWAFGRYGPGADRATSAALMLVGHDLMGARYPYGRMDVGALTDRSIAGFGADGPAVLAQARRHPGRRPRPVGPAGTVAAHRRRAPHRTGRPGHRHGARHRRRHGRRRCARHRRDRGCVRGIGGGAGDGHDRAATALPGSPSRRAPPTPGSPHPPGCPT